jgi:single-strand DNA-binding protein
MADGLNKVMLIGNLGADPELRMTSNGQAVLNMRIACSESYLDRNKVRQERTEWMSVVIWGKRAEALGKILSKGQRLYVEGGLRTSSYEDREGVKRYKTEVNATNVILFGGRRNANRDDRDDDPRGRNDGPDDDYGGSGGGGDDDIPF